MFDAARTAFSICAGDSAAGSASADGKAATSSASRGGESVNKSLGLVQDYEKDEDTDYYAQKLYKFAGRLKEAVGEDKFDTLFPKPVPVAKRPDPSQMTMDLFG